MPEKYQDEIEEILKGIEEEGPAVPPRNSQPIIDDLPLSLPDDRNRDSDRTGPRSRWLAVTPGKVALVALVILLIGVLLPPVRWLVWAGLLGLAAAYLLFFVRPRPANREKYWRGRSVESQGPSPWQRFKRWLGE